MKRDFKQTSGTLKVGQSNGICSTIEELMGNGKGQPVEPYTMKSGQEIIDTEQVKSEKQERKKSRSFL